MIRPLSLIINHYYGDSNFEADFLKKILNVNSLWKVLSTLVAKVVSLFPGVNSAIRFHFIVCYSGVKIKCNFLVFTFSPPRLLVPSCSSSIWTRDWQWLKDSHPTPSTAVPSTALASASMRMRSTSSHVPSALRPTAWRARQFTTINRVNSTKMTLNWGLLTMKLLDRQWRH